MYESSQSCLIHRKHTANVELSIVNWNPCLFGHNSADAMLLTENRVIPEGLRKSVSRHSVKVGPIWPECVVGLP